MVMNKLCRASLVCVHFLAVLVQHVMYFPEYVTWTIVLRPLLWLAPKLYWYIEARAYTSFLSLFALTSVYNRHKIYEYGADVECLRHKRCLVIANHQSLADVPLLFSILQKYRVLGDLMWVMDRILKYTHFGYCANVHGDAFIQQFTKTGRQSEMDSLANHVRDVYYPLDRKWVIVFPEGGFLYKRRARSQAYAKKNDLPILEHVSLPRLGAFQTLLESMSEEKNPGKGVKYIVDITIGHPNNNTMTLPSLMIGTQGPLDVHVNYRVFPLESVPKNNNNELTSWLYEVYVEKERLLDHFYRHNQFPEDNGYTRRLRYPVMARPWVNFFILHTFHMTSAILFYCLYYKIWCYAMS